MTYYVEVNYRCRDCDLLSDVKYPAKSLMLKHLWIQSLQHLWSMHCDHWVGWLKKDVVLAEKVRDEKILGQTANAWAALTLEVCREGRAWAQPLCFRTARRVLGEYVRQQTCCFILFSKKSRPVIVSSNSECIRTEFTQAGIILDILIIVVWIHYIVSHRILHCCPKA